MMNNKIKTRNKDMTLVLKMFILKINWDKKKRGLLKRNNLSLKKRNNIKKLK